MTNRELLQASREGLSAAQRQRQHLLHLELTPMPCPTCLQRVDALSAAGLDIDAYQFRTEPVNYRCPHCGAELERLMPVLTLSPGWYWQLQFSWLAARLHRANLYDQEHPGGQP